LALLGDIFVVFPAFLFFGLRWMAGRWIHTHPPAQVATETTPAGCVLYGFQIPFLLVCAASSQIDSTGHFGAFLHAPVAVMVSILGVFLAAAFLDHLG
jgi:hypothetical protein